MQGGFDFVCYLVTFLLVSLLCDAARESLSGLSVVSLLPSFVCSPFSGCLFLFTVDYTHIAFVKQFKASCLGFINPVKTTLRRAKALV